MLKFVRWLTGFVEFAFWGGFNEGFINSCLEKSYNISDVRIENGALYACCPAGLYPYLRAVAKEQGGRLKIIKKHGLVFKLLPLLNRPGLIAGGLAAVVLICTLSGMVWRVEVTGNKEIPKAAVLSLMEQNGLKAGVFKRSVDRGRLESLLLAAYPECAWAHINEYGTTFAVEISEGVVKPDTVKPDEYTNLIAEKDGVIVKATAFDGWAVKRKGEAVTKGDLLVSGVYESEKKKLNLFAHASGEYIAEVKEPVKLTVSREQSYKAYISENEYSYLYFFSLKIPLFISSVPEGDVSETAGYLYLNGERLPVGLIKKKVKTYTVQKKTLSDRELQSLASKQLENKLSSELDGCEIIKRKLTSSLNSDSITVKGYVICLENIGKEVKITP